MNEYVKLIQQDELTTEQRFRRYLKTSKYPMKSNPESILKDEIISTLYKDVENKKITWRMFLDEYRNLLDFRNQPHSDLDFSDEEQ